MELTKTADIPSNSPFAALTTMFYDPMKAFGMLSERRAVWLPLLLTMGLSAALMFYYYAVVDFEWLKERMLATVTDPAQREQSISMMTKSMVMISSIASAVLGIPLMCAITGVYFMIGGKMTSTDFGFGKGFALAAWSLVPMLITTVLGLMQVMLSSTGKLEFTELNPLTLNQLFFHIEMGKPWASLLESISLATVWQVILLIVGFQVWAKVPRATAMKVTLIPYVVIYGIWIAYSMMSNAA
ncbi:MAG: YIP1 family protein [Pseudomonadota bacterium]